MQLLKKVTNASELHAAYECESHDCSMRGYKVVTDSTPNESGWPICAECEEELCYLGLFAKAGTSLKLSDEEGSEVAVCSACLKDKHDPSVKGPCDVCGSPEPGSNELPALDPQCPEFRQDEGDASNKECICCGHLKECHDMKDASITIRPISGRTTVPVGKIKAVRYAMHDASYVQIEGMDSLIICLESTEEIVQMISAAKRKACVCRKR